MEGIKQTPVETEADNILELRNISKSFPGVKALNDVSFMLRRGEIHGLVGENGAGKSTLLKILSGVYKSDSGEMFYEGKLFLPKTPMDAQDQGICMEYQEKTAFPNLTAGENIVAGHWGQYTKSGRSVVVDWKKLHAAAGEIIAKLKFDIDTKEKMENLSPERQQIVQIAHAIAIRGKVLILDEPTAAISFSQVENLFTILRMLKDEGYSIIYVSHHLKEVFRITDRVTILKDGEAVGTFNTSGLTESEMMHYMVGRKVERVQHQTDLLNSETVFKVNGLTTKDGDIKDVSFTIRRGEIVGIAGLLGSGKELLPRAIVGLKPLACGTLELYGKKYKPKSPKHAIKSGITALPADRTIEGLVLEQSLVFNMTLSSFNRFTKGSWILQKQADELALAAANDVNLKYVTIKQAANSLSGGNQQRLMIARAFMTNAKMIIFNEPTQGVDVGAKAEIHKLIRRYADNGGAVILVSSELPELLSNSDRILVMSKGQINMELSAEEADEDKILESMIG